MNVIIDKQYLSADPIFLSFSKFSYRRNYDLKEGFKPKYNYKYIIFYKKIIKTTQQWKLCPQTQHNSLILL